MGTPPTLQDFREELLKQNEPEAQEIALAIELFTDGSLNTFAKHTNVDTHSRLICYDILDLGKQLQPIGMLVVLDSILNRITQNRAKDRNTFIFIDEIYGGYQGQIPRILQGASCSQKTDGNFKIRKEKPMKNYKSIICVVAAVCLLGTAAFCGFRIYHHYAQVDEQTEAFEEIAEMVEQAPTEKTVPDDTPVSEGEDVLAKYQELYLQNEDMVGWISIAGTTINYPVMQRRNNPNFYLKHNFEKEYSDLGTPYVQENCDIAESDNLVVYGHHIKGGKMFGALEDYKSKSFYEEHKTIQFDTLTEQAEYEIVAVFKTVAYSSEGFRYYDFVDAENEEEFNSYVGKCKELALYDTGVTAEYGDRLITLSTCEYSAQNGRLVVVAKKVG